MSNQTHTWVDEFKFNISQVSNSIKNNMKQPISDFINTIPFNDSKNTYYLPLRIQNEKWPKIFTQFKHNNILSLANENQRLILLGLSVLALVSVSKRFSSGLLPIIRKSVVTYFGSRNIQSFVGQVKYKKLKYCNQNIKQNDKKFDHLKNILSQVFQVEMINI